MICLAIWEHYTRVPWKTPQSVSRLLCKSTGYGVCEIRILVLTKESWRRSGSILRLMTCDNVSCNGSHPILYDSHV